jgi:protein involved in polysaccharide export with SLBB domain
MKPFAPSIALLSIAFLLAAAPSGRSAVPKVGVKSDKLAEIQQKAGEGETTTGAQEKAAKALEKLPMLERAVDPDSYVLGPYDELAVTIMGPEPRTYLTNVLPEGDVLVPEVGPVHADGLTLTEFRRALAATVDRFYHNIELYCYLQTPAQFRVFVTGEVENPGVVAVSGVERVTDAIGKAGDVKAGGSLRHIVLERDGKRIRVDLLRFLDLGDLENNPFLRSGDRVNVPPWGWHAAISGQVKKPGSYEIVEGETIADLVTLAGGFSVEAVRDSILMTRVAADGSATTSAVPRERFDTPLRDLDEFGVFDREKGRRYVYVEGAMNRTGRYILARDEGLDDLIVRGGGLQYNADLTSAYIQHRDGTTVKVDLAAYMSPDPSKDIAIEDGDALMIPFMRSTVSVGGEVNAPGEFSYSGDLSVVQYIGLAGGPTKDGSVDRIAIYSPDGRLRGGDRNTHPNRGDVIIVKRSHYKIAGDFFGGVLRIGTLVVSILILNR